MRTTTLLKDLARQIPILLKKYGELHYLEIAKQFKANPKTVAVIMTQLRQRGLVENPTIILRKRKAGYYQIPSGK